MKLIMENWKRFLKESRDEHPEDEDLDPEPWSQDKKDDFNREWDAMEKLNPAPEIEVDLDESMSAYDLGAELRSIQGDTMHPGDKTSPPAIRMMDVVSLYGSSIEQAVKALHSLGKGDLAEKLRAELERAKKYVKGGHDLVVFKDEQDATGKLQSGAEKFYAIFDVAGDALIAAKANEE